MLKSNIRPLLRLIVNGLLEVNGFDIEARGAGGGLVVVVIVVGGGSADGALGAPLLGITGA